MSVISRKYNGEIDWNIGALFAHYKETYDFLVNLHNNRIKHPIKYAFGSFTTKWNSGRQVMGGKYNFEILSKGIALLNELGISTRMTFSNHLLTEEDLDDIPCNEMLDYLDKVNKNTGLENGVILVSDMLTKYIRDNYPNLKLTSSLYKVGLETSFITDTADYYNRLAEIYDMVVVDNNKVKDNNIALLNKLHNKDQFEFIANNHCGRHCRNVAMHDEAVARIQLAIINNDMKEIAHWQNIIDKCMKECNRIYKITGEQLVFTFDEINMLIDMGFKHFKIQGRASSIKSFFSDMLMYIFDDDENPVQFTNIEKAY